MMTRSELEALVAEARRYGGTGLEAPLAAILRHDAEQREEIERLQDQWHELTRENGELHGLQHANAQLTAQVQALREALRQAISIANGLTNYVEDRPGLRDAERRLKQLEKQALTQEPQ